MSRLITFCPVIIALALLSKTASAFDIVRFQDSNVEIGDSLKEPSIAVSPTNSRRMLLAANYDLGLNANDKKKHVRWSLSVDSGKTWSRVRLTFLT